MIEDILSGLIPAALAVMLAILGMKARRLREEKKLGDLFKDAMKEKEYRTIIAGMVLVLLIAAFYTVKIGY